MNLSQIDLNLLILFDALYRNRSVSKAANEVFLSQSAFSHGLSRLRKHLADELFVRINNVMEPTSLAHELAVNISPALNKIHRSLNNNLVFEPAKSELELTFAATDYTQFSLLPKLVGKITKIAPNIKIKVIPSEDKIPTEKLINGEIDFVLGFSHEFEKSSVIEQLTWLEDEYCTIARKNHPKLSKGLTLDQFLALSHARISPWGELTAIIDETLAEKGLTRKVVLQLSSVMASPYAILHSDLLLTLPKLIVESVIGQLDIDVFQPPILVPNYQLNLYWHKLHSNKASHRWLIELVNQL